MSFYDICRRYQGCDWDGLFGSAGERFSAGAIEADELSADQFAGLLSAAAAARLEEMARRARSLTMKHFGRTIQLYTPLYISNYCDNGCVYCGFSVHNGIKRRRLSSEELEKEASAISATGIRHILILTGGSRAMSPVSYIGDCVRILRPHFASIAVEVYALTEDEYAILVREGVDGLTIYQEVYDESLYAGLHPSGPKSDFIFRLGAPERASRAGMRSVSVGALLGLDDWRKEIFLTGLHAKYMQENFPSVEIGAAIPRMRPHAGARGVGSCVPDKDIVQAVLALRIFLPRLSLTLSTREDARFRENLLGLGITRMSAGSRTSVGGYAAGPGGAGAPEQFEISDERTVAEVIDMLGNKGYQPVLKDWMRI